MTDKKQALTDLLEKVEAGDARPHQVFNAFDTPCQDMALQQRAEDAKNAYNGSLDAAKALHEAVLPGWGYAVSPQYARVVDPIPLYGSPNKSKDAINADNPARAWLIALLKALIAECDA